MLTTGAYGQQRTKSWKVKENKNPSLPLSAIKHISYHVSVENGNDNNNGTSESSTFKTIQKEAEMAQPGDTILVYAGTYRERVKPVRVGTSESNRITYMRPLQSNYVITYCQSIN